MSQVVADCPPTHISPVYIIMNMLWCMCAHLHTLQVCVRVCGTRKRTFVQMVCWCLDGVVHTNAATLCNYHNSLLIYRSFIIYERR